MGSATMTERGVSVSRAAFLDALSRVALVAPRGGGSLPVLQSVRIAPDGDTLRLTVTDLDRTVSVSVPVDGAEDLPTRVVPCARLLAIVAQIPASTIVIAARGDGVRITANRARFDLTGVSADEFPVALMDGESTSASVTVDAAAFVSALTRCVSCAAREGGMTALEGVHVKAAKHGRLQVEAADRHQLAREVIERPSGPALDFILHSSSVAVAAKLFTNTDRLTVDLCGLKVRCVSDDASVKFEASLMEGPYPDTAPIIKRDLPHTASVDRIALLSAVKRVAAVSVNEKLLIRMDWNADHVTVSGVGDDAVGTSEDVVSCDLASGAPIRIAFAPRLLIHALSLRTTDTIHVALRDANNMMTFRDDDATEIQNLVMPRREF